MYRRAGASFITVHAAGGVEMMRQAMFAAHRTDGEWANVREIEIIAITVLTSLDETDTRSVYRRSVAPQVEVLYRLARLAGVDGFVCSAADLDTLDAENPLTGLADDPHCFQNFLGRVITPGIRGPNNPVNDQKRVATPREAIEAGASHLVIGRSVMRGKATHCE